MKPASVLAIVFAILCVVLLVGIAGSTVAATVEIESIVATGPIFSLVGLATALGIFVSRSPANLLFGLSTPAFSACVFALIFSNGWSPQQAYPPVSAIILGYETLVIPLGLLSLYRTVQVVAGPAVETGRWQFNLRTLFYIVLISSLSLGAGRTCFHLGGNVRVAIASGICLLTVFSILLTGWLALRMQVPNLQSADGKSEGTPFAK